LGEEEEEEKAAEDEARARGRYACEEIIYRHFAFTGDVGKEATAGMLKGSNGRYAKRKQRQVCCASSSIQLMAFNWHSSRLYAS
jgi:hypothetical protein